MYKKDGQEPPVTGWTGLWLFPFGIFLIPAIVWFVKVQGSLNRYWEGKGAAARPEQAVEPLAATLASGRGWCYLSSGRRGRPVDQARR